MKQALVSLITLLAATIASCGTASRRGSVMSLAEVVSAADEFDGRSVTVEASLHDTGVHGMFLLDLHDPRKGLNLHIEPEIAWSTPVIEMTRMLLIDRDREEPLGVVGHFTGTFFRKQEGLSLLSVSKVANLRWGTRSSPMNDGQSLSARDESIPSARCNLDSATLLLRCSVPKVCGLTFKALSALLSEDRAS